MTSIGDLWIMLAAFAALVAVGTLLDLWDDWQRRRNWPPRDGE